MIASSCVQDCLLLGWISVQILAVESWAPPPALTCIRGRMVPSYHHLQSPFKRGRDHNIDSSPLYSSSVALPDDGLASPLPMLSVHQALQSRYACTRFQRFDGIKSSNDLPSPSNGTVVQLATQALEEARRAPSGFNAQPYKLILVSNATQKEALSRWCCGHNAHRVRDSDCTVVFLADRQGIWELPSYRKNMVLGGNKSWTKLALIKIQVLVGLFSQGLPLPYWLSAPIGWMLRLGMRMVSWMTRRWLPIPTLSNPDTWAQKNTMLVSMAYLLGCTSRGLQTSPMEGYCAWGIKQALNIPRRYSIPLIVATGTAYHQQQPTKASDDVGMVHGPKSMTLRYPQETMIFENTFGVVQ